MQGYLDLYTYKNLTNYQEYINSDYCIVCSYFKATKGHFGYCIDLLNGKVYDGTKKGTGCPLWRLQGKYFNNGIKQVLPEKPILKHNFSKCRVRPKNPMIQWKKPRQHIPRRAVKCRVCNAIFIWNARRLNQDLCNSHSKVYIQLQKHNNLRLTMETAISKPVEIPMDYCI